MAIVRRAQPRFVNAGSKQFLSPSPVFATLITGAHVAAPAGAVRAELHDVTATQTLTASTKRVELFASASGSSELTSLLQFNTGLAVTCAGADGGITVFYAGSAGIPTPSGV
mgnify:CR=1 FL=1|tara:strand:- start:2696 stop:3031 length:336 start_codon:yes stop_codon:yes gene_type:complete